MEGEYERKMKLQEERILFRRSKQEERDVGEYKREQMIQREELKQQIQEKQEELDYMN